MAHYMYQKTVHANESMEGVVNTAQRLFKKVEKGTPLYKAIAELRDAAGTGAYAFGIMARGLQKDDQANFSKGFDMLVKKRIAISNLYKQALKGCSWLIPQAVPEGVKHSYWTFVVRLDNKKKPVSWEKFREVFLNEGGEAFYGAWSLTYLEPALEGMKFPKHNVKYNRGLCPVAESIQPYLVQLKTNFESLDHAKSQADILAKTIRILDK